MARVIVDYPSVKPFLSKRLNAREQSAALIDYHEATELRSDLLLRQKPYYATVLAMLRHGDFSIAVMR